MFAAWKHSPFCLHTQSLPSAAWRVNLDSSVNITLVHCCLVQMRCVWGPFKWALRWCCVNGTPTNKCLLLNAAALTWLQTVSNESLDPVEACKRVANAVQVKNQLCHNKVTSYSLHSSHCSFLLSSRSQAIFYNACLSVLGLETVNHSFMHLKMACDMDNTQTTLEHTDSDEPVIQCHARGLSHDVF